MKKLLLLLLSIVFSGTAVFACGLPSTYSATSTDTQLVESLYPKIDQIFVKDYLQGNQLMMKLKEVSMNFDLDSREYFIIRELHMYMNEKITSNIIVPSYISSGGQFASYMQYSPLAYDEAIKAGFKVVLNFRASRCPRCKATSQEIIAHHAEIPAGTIIMEIDYDTSKALQKELGVTMQTTFVFFDTRGNMIKKVEKLTGIDQLLKELK